MKRLLPGLLSALVFFTVVPVAIAQVPIASGFGEANIGGERVYVHVTVAVPPGIDRAQAVADGVRGLGARPIDSAAFSLTGMDWDGHSVGSFGSGLTQSYSSGMTNTQVTALTNTHLTWNAVGKSDFGFANGGPTSRCPSLARECPGAQFRDGFNDVAFVAIGGCCTLGATWYVTSGEPEADMVINSRFNWNSASLDLETVLLHENGHALGLGHSNVADAVMVATYVDERRDLAEDDERGVTYLYPALGGAATIEGLVTDTSGNPIPGAAVAIADFPGPTATTDGNGDYAISGVPTIGLYDVTASADGYESLTKQAPSPGDLNFFLSGGGGGGGNDGNNSNGGGCKKAGKKAC